MANLSLFEYENDGIVFEAEADGGGTYEKILCLVGKFISERNVNFNTMKQRMTAIWRPIKGLTVKDIGNQQFMFQFYHAQDLKRVMDGGPWDFDNLRLMLVQVGRQLGDFIGNFLEYDPRSSNSIWKTFMRIKVGVDVRLPLKRCKKVKLQGEDWYVVNFMYERLGSFCFVCGMLSYIDLFCEKRVELLDGKPVKEWGPSLRANNRRNIDTSGERWFIEDRDND
ncbi:hypothetical protein DH2020_008129 [Rehmannia glutinosa]|uniref:DUF4283 domain-containing protein n=1 Tax=Rehmannia glutinosa TaxID=99300 RepID=A0ABR0U0Y8_REHGL